MYHRRKVVVINVGLAFGSGAGRAGVRLWGGSVGVLLNHVRVPLRDLVQASGCSAQWRVVSSVCVAAGGVLWVRHSRLAVHGSV